MEAIMLSGNRLSIIPSMTAPARVKTWNLSERTLNNPTNQAAGTYVFVYNGGNYLTFTPGQTDREYWTGGYVLSTPRIFNSSNSANFPTVTSITNDGFSYTGGTYTENFMMIPYQVKAGETVTWTYTRSSTNRGGYILFDSNEQYLSATLLNRSGGGTQTETVQIAQDGWILICFGKYDSNGNNILSDCALSIYTNLFIPSDAGLNQRFSSTGSISGSAENGSFVVGNYIDVSSIDKTKTTYMYVKGAKPINANTVAKFSYAVAYNSNKAVLASSQYHTATGVNFEYESLGTNYGRFKLSNINAWANAAYIRCNFFVNTTGTAITASDIEDVVITIDEPIE